MKTKEEIKNININYFRTLIGQLQLSDKTDENTYKFVALKLASLYDGGNYGK